jgi:hypothetical protein
MSFSDNLIRRARLLFNPSIIRKVLQNNIKCCLQGLRDLDLARSPSISIIHPYG